MKNIKILSFILLSVMLLSILAGCTGAEQKTVNVTVTVTYQNEKLAEDDVTVTDETPTPVLALQELCTKLEIPYVLESNGYSLEKFDDKSAYIDEEAKLSFFWNLKINGVEPKSGNAGNIELKEGDKIEYFFTSIEYKPTELKDPDTTK